MNLLPYDWLALGYLAITGALILIFYKKVRFWYIHLIVRVFVITGIFLITSTQEPLSLLLQVIRDWYPMATLSLFYLEMRNLAQMIFSCYFDEKVIHWEKKFFKGMPSLGLSSIFPSILLSEFLHFCYLALYAIAYFFPVQLYLENKIDAFREIVFAETLIINLGLLWYPFFPCVGPRYLFGKIKGKLSRGFFFQLTHLILSRGSSKGTAFPSSHVSLSMIILLCGFYYDSTTALILLPICIGLTLSTVYCRFHYAVDALAGLILAVVVFFILHLIPN